MIELVIDKLLGGAFLMSLRIWNERALLLLCTLHITLNFVDLHILPVCKSLLPANELVFFLVFLHNLFNLFLLNNKMYSITVDVLNEILKLWLIRCFYYTLSIGLLLNRTCYTFDLDYGKRLIVLHLLQ